MNSCACTENRMDLYMSGWKWRKCIYFHLILHHFMDGAYRRGKLKPTRKRNDGECSKKHCCLYLVCIRLKGICLR